MVQQYTITVLLIVIEKVRP